MKLFSQIPWFIDCVPLRRMVNIATFICTVNGWLGFEIKFLGQTIDEKIPSVFVLHFES